MLSELFPYGLAPWHGSRGGLCTTSLNHSTTLPKTVPSIFCPSQGPDPLCLAFLPPNRHLPCGTYCLLARNALAST